MIEITPDMSIEDRKKLANQCIKILGGVIPSARYTGLSPDSIRKWKNKNTQPSIKSLERMREAAMAIRDSNGKELEVIKVTMRANNSGESVPKEFDCSLCNHNKSGIEICTHPLFGTAKFSKMTQVECFEKRVFHG